MNLDIVALVDARRGDDAALENDHGQRRIGAGIVADVDIQGSELSVLERAADLRFRGVLLGCDRHVLFSGQNDPDRLSGFQRCDSGLTSQHGRIVFLAAEAAARNVLDHPQLARFHIENGLQRRDEIERTLHRTVDDDAARFRVRLRDHPLCFEIRLFLSSGMEGFLVNQIGFLKFLIRVSLAVVVFKEIHVALMRIVYERKLLILYDHFGQKTVHRFRIGTDDQADRVSDIPDFLHSEYRRVAETHLDLVPGRNIPVIDIEIAFRKFGYGYIPDHCVRFCGSEYAGRKQICVRIIRRIDRSAAYFFPMVPFGY